MTSIPPDRSHTITVGMEHRKPETVLLEDIAKYCHERFPCDVRFAVYEIGKTYHEEALCQKKGHDDIWMKIYSQRAIYAFQFLLKCKSPVKCLCVSALYYIGDLHYECTDLRDTYLSFYLFDRVVSLSEMTAVEYSGAKSKLDIIRKDILKRYKTRNQLKQVLNKLKTGNNIKFNYPKYIKLLEKLDDSMQDTNSLPGVIKCSSDN